MTNNKPPTNRVLRGGVWDSYAYLARCANRYDGFPDGAYDFLGFRLVLKPTTLQQNDK
jgi:formylglycine-generating enzyme required for sulfatase activity